MSWSSFLPGAAKVIRICPVRPINKIVEETRPGLQWNGDTEKPVKRRLIIHPLRSERDTKAVDREKNRRSLLVSPPPPPLLRCPKNPNGVATRSNRDKQTYIVVSGHSIPGSEFNASEPRLVRRDWISSGLDNCDSATLSSLAFP